MRISVSHSTRLPVRRPVFLEPHTVPPAAARRRRAAADRGTQLEIAPRPAGSAWLSRSGRQRRAGDMVPAGRPSNCAVSSCFEVETLRENPFDFLLPLPPALALPATAPAELAAYVARTHGCRGARVRAIDFDGVGQADDAVPEGARQTCCSTSCARCTAGRRAAQRGGYPGGRGRAPAATCRSCSAPAAGRSAFPRGSSAGTSGSRRFGNHALHARLGRGLHPGRRMAGVRSVAGTGGRTSHVAVAAAADPAMAAPTSGTYRGAARSGMEFQIQMQAG